MIKKCYVMDCVSEYQDKRYGKKKRIYNEKVDNKLRCTVCGNIIDGSEYNIKKNQGKR